MVPVTSRLLDIFPVAVTAEMPTLYAINTRASRPSTWGRNCRRRGLNEVFLSFVRTRPNHFDGRHVFHVMVMWRANGQGICLLFVGFKLLPFGSHFGRVGKELLAKDLGKKLIDLRVW